MNFRNTDWLPARVLVMAFAAAIAVAGATGFTQAHEFLLPTSLKYALTVAGPLLIFFAAAVRRPLHLIAGVLIVVAPFANVTAQFEGVRVSPLVPLLILGFGLIAASAPQPGRRAALRWAGVLAFPLMLLPLASGSGTHQFIMSLLLLITIAWIVSCAATDAEGLRVVVLALALQAAVQGAIAIWEWRTGHVLNIYSSVGGSQANAAVPNIFTIGKVARPVGTLNDPISLGNVLAISVPPVAILCFTTRSLVTRLMLGVALGLSGLALGLSLDRTSWIAAAAGLVFALAVLPRGWRHKVIPQAAIAAVAVVAAVLLVAGPAISERFSSIFDPTSTQGKTQQEKGTAIGETLRLQYWSTELTYGFERHLVAGIGIGRSGLLELEHTPSSGLGVRAGTAGFANAASTYFQLIGEAGLFAVALLIILFSGIVADIRAALRAFPVIAAGLAGGVIALLICWVTDVVVLYEPVAASVGVVLGALAGAGRSGGPVGRTASQA